MELKAEFVELPKPKKRKAPSKSLIFFNYFLTLNLYLISFYYFKSTAMIIFIGVIINLFFINFIFGKVRQESICLWNSILFMVIMKEFDYYSIISIVSSITLLINFLYLRAGIKRALSNK